MNWWWRGGLALIAAAVGAQTWKFTHPPHSTLGSERDASGTLLDVLTPSVAFAALIVAALYLSDRLGVALLRRIARFLPTTGTGTLALTRHTLDSRRSPEGGNFMTSRTDMGGMVLAIALVTSGLWAWTLDNAVFAQSHALTWDAVVVSDIVPTQDTLGARETVLDPTVLDALNRRPGIVAVPVSEVIVGATGPARNGPAVGTLYAVAPADLDAVVPDGARPLGLQDGVILSYDSYDGSSTFPAPYGLVDADTGKGQATVFHVGSASPVAITTRSWAEGVFGELPISGALVKATDTRLDAAERFALVSDAARAVGAQARRVPTLSASEKEIAVDARRYSGAGLGFLVVLLTIAAVGTTLTLSVRTARAHRRVRATVAALGAPPRSLVAALMLDAAITLGVAVVLGSPLGALAAIAVGHPTLGSAGAPFDANEVLWILGWNFEHLAWQPVGLALGGTWLVAVGAVGAYGVYTQRRTPVEELREAVKEGAL